MNVAIEIPSEVCLDGETCAVKSVQPLQEGALLTLSNGTVAHLDEVRAVKSTKQLHPRKVLHEDAVLFAQVAKGRSLEPGEVKLMRDHLDHHLDGIRRFNPQLAKHASVAKIEQLLRGKGGQDVFGKVAGLTKGLAGKSAKADKILLRIQAAQKMAQAAQTLMQRASREQTEARQGAGYAKAMLAVQAARGELRTAQGSLRGGATRRVLNMSYGVLLGITKRWQQNRQGSFSEELSELKKVLRYLDKAMSMYEPARRSAKVGPGFDPVKNKLVTMLRTLESAYGSMDKNNEFIPRGGFGSLESAIVRVLRDLKALKQQLSKQRGSQVRVNRRTLQAIGAAYTIVRQASINMNPMDKYPYRDYWIVARGLRQAVDKVLEAVNAWQSPGRGGRRSAKAMPGVREAMIGSLQRGKR